MAGRTSTDARKARRDARDERQTRVVNLNTGDVQRVDRGKLKTVKQVGYGINHRIEPTIQENRANSDRIRADSGRSSSGQVQRLKTPSTTAQRLKNATTGPKNRLEMEVRSRKTRKLLEDAFKKRGK